MYFFQPFMSPRLGALTSISLFSSTFNPATPSTTIPWPAGIQAGDLAVLTDTSMNFSTPGTVVPTGFTQIVNVTGGGTLVARVIQSYRILDGTESGSITGNLSSYSYNSKILYIFRGNVLISTVTPSTWNSQATTGDPNAQTVLASSGTPPLIVLGCGLGANGGEIFTTASPTFDATQQYGNAAANISGYKIYTSSPADHSIDVSANGNPNALVSGYLALT